MRFFIVDVFAENKYQGNQLAVFIPNKSLSKVEMQQIAKEMNFSETTFIGPRTDGGAYDVRIFTPEVEIPFAGHPTLGTAYVINNILSKDLYEELVLNLGVGEITVTFDKTNKNELWMKQKSPHFDKTIAPEVVADILELGREDINLKFPIQIVSTGLPAVIIPVKTINAVKKCKINHKKFQDFIDTTCKANLLAFSPQAQQEGNDIHARVFMDDAGFLEDAATGSANGNLAAYLLKYQVLEKSKISINVEQGYSIGRPSLIKINAELVDGMFKILVGGKVFLMAKGTWL